jgi:dynein heavy chain
MDTRYPSAETVFEYSVDARNRQWLSWDSRLSSGFKPRADVPAYRLLVPTVDTVRNTYVAGALVRSRVHTLVVGGVGVGKTMTMQSMLEGLPGTQWASCTINFSAQTTSNSLQVMRRTKGRACVRCTPATAVSPATSRACGAACRDAGHD